MSVTVEVPATSANLGAGYDCLGLALDVVNRIEVEVVARGAFEGAAGSGGASRVELTVEGEGAGELRGDASNRFVRGLEGALATGVALAGPDGPGTVDPATGLQVGALVAVNSRGYTTMGDMPQFWAWALEQDGEFGGLPPPRHGLGLPVSHNRADLSHDPADAVRSDPRANTTIAVVATNAKLDKASAKRLAVMAQDGLARSIRPVHTPQDGDTVFAIATGRHDVGTDPLALGELGTLAADCLARAVARGKLRPGGNLRRLLEVLAAVRRLRSERRRLLDRLREGRLPEGWEAPLRTFREEAAGKAQSGIALSGELVDRLAAAIPETQAAAIQKATDSGLPLSVVYPAQRHLPLRVRAFIDWLARIQFVSGVK